MLCFKVIKLLVKKLLECKMYFVVLAAILVNGEERDSSKHSLVKCNSSGLAGNMIGGAAAGREEEKCLREADFDRIEERGGIANTSLSSGLLPLASWQKFFASPTYIPR